MCKEKQWRIDAQEMYLQKIVLVRRDIELIDNNLPIINRFRYNGLENPSTGMLNAQFFKNHCLTERHAIFVLF